MKIFLSVLLFIVGFAAFANEQLQFLHFDKTNDFPFNSVDCIVQDSYGYLWIGSSSGLARYDGYSFELYTTQDKNNGLPSNRIFCIFETSSNDVMIGTNLGLVVFNREKNTFRLLSYSCTTHIFEDNYQNVWVTTFDGVDVRDSETLDLTTCFLCEEDDNIMAFDHLSIDSYDRVWAISKGKGIFIFDSKTKKQVKHIGDSILSGIEELRITELCFDNFGKLWMASRGNGLVCVDTSTYSYDKYTTNATDASTIGSNNVIDIYVDTKNELWVSCEYGYLNRYNRQEKNFERFIPNINNARSINSNSILSVNQDKRGNYWIGTAGEGMYCLSEMYNNFKTFISYPDFSNNNTLGSITSFVELENEKIALGCNGGGLKFLDPTTNTITEFVENDILQSKNIHNLIRQGNELWGTAWGGGIFKVDLKSNRLNKFVFDLNNLTTINAVNVTHVFPTDTILILSTNGEGIMVYDIRTKTFLNRSNSQSPYFDPIVNKWVNHILEDSRGNIWISTYYGLNKLSNGKLTHYAHDSTINSINSFEVLSTYEDSNNQLWVLTTNGVDLYNYRQDNFSRISEQLKLPSNTRSFVEDNDGLLWICSDDKIVTISPSLEVVATYDKNDGIVSGDMNINAVFKASNGTLYFGSSDGFMSCQPSLMNKDTVVPQLCFRNLYVNYDKQTASSDYLDQSMETTSVLEYVYNEDVMSIEIAAILFGRNNKINYAYTFDEDQNNWLQLGKERIISFTGLRPGRYILSVKASVENGREVQKSIIIIVHPKWWMTWWFYTVISLVIVALILLYIYWRIRKIQRYNDELEELVRQRTQNLKEANNKLVQQSDLLQKQFENLQETKLVMEMKNEELTEALSTKDKLIGVISHDFKNPLNVLLGIMGLIKNENSDKEKMSRYIESAEKSVKKLVAQMTTVLEWAQGNLLNIKNKPVDVNLESLIIDTIQLLHGSAQQKNINIETQTDISYCAYTDPRMMNTVFRNLLHNAIKFTPEGGNVIITINEDDTMLEVSFVDTGIGMPQQKLDELFTTFNPENISYGTNAEKGTGLGLNICKTFVEKNSGVIHAKSEEGKGSVFTVSLPKGKTKVSKVILPSSQNNFIIPEDNVSSESQHTILLIDDNEELVAILQNSLRQNYKIIKAYEGKAGLHLAQNMVPDIIISDIYMPKMTGFEVCKQIKADSITCHIPVILISSEKRENVEEECYKSGANDFLEKPFETSILKYKVNSLLSTISTISKTNANKESQIFDLPDSADDIILKKIIELVNENIQDPNYDIDTIATKIGLSRTQLWRKIKASLNMTPSELIRELRMKKAEEMLVTGKYRVSDVAYYVGYNDPKVFQRNFSKIYNMTPSEYLKKHREE